MRLLPLSVCLFVSLAGCGGDDDGGNTNTSTAAVTVKVINNRFDPPNVTVKPGQTVEWQFQQGAHDVVSGSKDMAGACTADGKFGSQIQTSGTFRHTFTTAGTYPYFCTPHCDVNMLGTVTVQ